MLPVNIVMEFFFQFDYWQAMIIDCIDKKHNLESALIVL